MIEEPQTEQELLERANTLTGLTLLQLAEHCNFTLPENFQHHKGWLGQLIELALGATSGSLSQPDFAKLGIELKTIPVNSQNKPVESTFVCAVPQKSAVHWRDSNVWQKLKKVLWIPISSAEKIPERRIGKTILWQPNLNQEKILQQDWEELTDMLVLGHADQVTASIGQALQIRPKAANSRVLTASLDEYSEETFIVPRGFYLRAAFTAEIFKN